MTRGPIVVKLGGRALEDATAVAGLAQAVRALEAQGLAVIIVHGGGAEVSAWSERLGLQPHFHGGRRVTDAATLEIATAVLAGLANKRLVAALRAGGVGVGSTRAVMAGVDAVGLSALDGGIARVEPHADAALGAVGQIAGVDAGLLHELLAARRTPVLASIGAAHGRLLNLNADDLAAAIAPAVGAGGLVLLSDAPGLMLDGALVPALDRAALEAALVHPQVSGGMRPKLACARSALAGGVAEVWIAAWSGPTTLGDLLAGGRRGTRITLTGSAGHPMNAGHRSIPEEVSRG